MAEATLYRPVQDKLTELLSRVAGNFHLQTGGSKGFSEKLKAAIPAGHEIVFKFLTKRPDIFGFVERQFGNDLITVEVKEKTITLKDIYQAKLYKEVFDARYAFRLKLIYKLCAMRILLENKTFTVWGSTGIRIIEPGKGG